MAIEWITVKSKKEVAEAEELYCVSLGDFGEPSSYPAMGFLHANFHGSQCIEWLTIEALEHKLSHLKHITQ